VDGIPNLTELLYIRLDNSDKELTERITINEDLRHDRASAVSVLNLLDHDELTLSQLDDLLAATNDANAIAVDDLDNIASGEPAIRGEHSSCDLRITEVAREHVSTMDETFTTRIRLVIDAEAKLRNVTELDLTVGHERTTVKRLRIIDASNGDRVTFGHTVTLNDVAAEADLEETMDFGSKRGRASDDELHTTT